MVEVVREASSGSSRASMILGIVCIDWPALVLQDRSDIVADDPWPPCEADEPKALASARESACSRPLGGHGDHHFALINCVGGLAAGERMRSPGILHLMSGSLPSSSHNAPRWLFGVRLPDEITELVRNPFVVFAPLAARRNQVDPKHQVPPAAFVKSTIPWRCHHSASRSHSPSEIEPFVFVGSSLAQGSPLSLSPNS